MFLNHETVAEIVNNTTNWGMGVSCLFLKIGKVGVKLYADSKLCGDTRALQEMGWMDGLAPKVLGTALAVIDGTKLSRLPHEWPREPRVRAFGYLTELAEHGNDYGCEDLHELECKLYQMGYDTADAHYGNVGRHIDTGELMLIDWDAKRLELV